MLALGLDVLLPQQYSQPLSWRTQKNVDYSLLQALKTTNVDPDDQAIVFAYDVVCTHCVHFIYRIGHLLPPGTKFDFAIGLFHVHGHKDECFFHYSPAFIPESGAFAGEILESLWALVVTKLMIKSRQLPARSLCIMPRCLMRRLILLPGHFIH